MDTIRIYVLLSGGYNYHTFSEKKIIFFDKILSNR